MTTTNQLPAATLDRVIAAMKGFDIELTQFQEHDIATANLNGMPCTFAVLDTVVIVRCEVGTDAEFDSADAGLLLAANQINSASFGARAVIAEHEGKLIVRTERDIPVAAGISDAQLSSCLKAAVDGAVGAQDAMVAAAEEMQKLNNHRDDQTGENPPA